VSLLNLSIKSDSNSIDFARSSTKLCGQIFAVSLDFVNDRPRTGIGNGIVSYSVAPNPGTAGRNGMITIAGRTFSIKQKGA